MENVPKKRGRKKKIIDNEELNQSSNNNLENKLDSDKNKGDKLGKSNELDSSKNKSSNSNLDNNEKLQEQIVIKKRGRKKKWEVETKTKTLNNNPIIFGDLSIKEEANTTQSITEDKINYEQEQISFGNLNIKIQSNKENTNISAIKNLLKENSNNNSTNKNISAILKSSKQKNPISITNNNRQFKILKFFEDEYSQGTEIVKSDFRCYNCHHNFPNKPFYLPVDYCQELNRYKVMGNFCSPNCVKSYALSHKIYSNKAYLVGQMYRKLLGHQIIKKAPPIQCLREYGGYMDISEYRDTFNKYDNTSYSINNLNSKVLFEEISIRNSII